MESTLLLAFSLILLGIALLYAGGELLVDNSIRLAKTFDVSNMVIGLTVVAFGTSCPELATSLAAALEGSPDIALGNVFGSNVANIALILGLSAVIMPFTVTVAFLRREAAFMIVLGGSDENARALLAALEGNAELQQTLLFAIRDDQSNAFNLVTAGGFESGAVWRRLSVAHILNEGEGDYRQRLERLKHVLELFGLERGGNSQSEKYVERSCGHIAPERGRGRRRNEHLFQQW